MAKAVGIDAGEYEVKVVELDGSLKRPRLTKFAVHALANGSSSAGDETHALREARATAAAIDEGGIAKDNLCIAFPCREAVLRTLTVPFVGRDQIRKVIKFEAEGTIHSHNVDDMVVDFMALDEREVDTRVMVAAVPKPALRTTLTGLERAGLEPEVVDLDTMALFRVAEWCGVLTGPIGEAAETPGTEVAALDADPPARVVLDLGARSTRVLVFARGSLVDMRALRLGADGIADEVAEAVGIDRAQAREAIVESLRTDEDFIVEEAADQDADEGEAEREAVPAAGHLVPHDRVAVARDRYLERLRRELVRFLASVRGVGPIEAVWVTGGASRTPGAAELVRDVFAVEPRELDVLSQLSHRLDADEAAELGPKLAIAVGLALASLGGRRGFNFRQEDLAFTRGFDRIKFPLAIACMLGLFLVLVFALKSWRELKVMRGEYGDVFSVTEEERRGSVKREVLFQGYVGTQVNPRHGWFDNPLYYEDRGFDKLVDKVLDTDVFKRLPVIKQELIKYFREEQQKSGYYADLRLGSGLGALVEMAEVLERVEPQLGRYLLTELDLKVPAEDQGRSLQFMVALRTDEKSGFRQKWEVLERAFREVCGTPDSSFLELDDKTQAKTGEVPPPFSGESGGGSYFRISINLKPEGTYPTFPKEMPK